MMTVPALFLALVEFTAAALARTTLYSTFFLFTTSIAVGTAAALLFVPIGLIGRRFFVLMTLLAVVFVALAMSESGLATGYLYVAFAALLITYNVILPRQSGVDVSTRREAREGGPRRLLTMLSQGLLLVAGACGVTALVVDAWSYPVGLELAASQAPWIAGAFLTSALLLGGSLVAMVLGHWYLVLRGLSFRPLGRLSVLVLVAVLLRLVVASATVYLQRARWEDLLSPGWTTFFVDTGVFVTTRVVFGFVAPAILAWMTWQCVKIRSNQSATGLLYVTLAFVLIGEIIAKYFLVSERLLI